MLESEVKNEIAELTEPESLTTSEQLELESRSQPFLGKWNRLISHTNWEKGAIIVDWQATLAADGLKNSRHSDEHWSRLAGGATPQHVGRLRRTFTRFGHVYQEYDGLYWSHFYAALDWDDAEMWLEGALQNSWSVSRMRNMRWETLGKRPEDQPRIEQIVISELDEETHSLKDPSPVSKGDREYIAGPIPEGPDFGDADGDSPSPSRTLADGNNAAAAKSSGPKSRPFESFTDLPDDLQAAANSFKIAIINHKTAGWERISLLDLHSLLDALKALATSAPG